jgi:tetratricopeptide (TPR) repeat protein
MKIHPTLKISSKIALGLCCLIFFLLSNACNETKNNPNNALVDSVLAYDYTIPLTKKEDSKLNQIRSSIKTDDITRLTKFYRLKFYYNRFGTGTAYADSALALFKDGSFKESDKADYLNAMLLKAEELYINKKYNNAVLVYFDAKSFRDKYLDICYGGPINARIADIYYAQGNFLRAASYYKESYVMQSKCYEKTPTFNQFYIVQGLLNNIGYCYEQADMLDSAQYFYQKDLAYIESAQKNGNIHEDILNDAKIVVFDNMGGVYLKRNQLDQAEAYLLKTISMEYKGGDGMYTTPLIKLAKLYTLKGNFDKAELYFNKSRLLLDRFPSTDFEARWHKAKAGFYALQNKHQLAYQYHKNS